MADEVNVNLAIHPMPDGTKRVRLLVFSGTVFQFFILLAPEEAGVIGKKMQGIATEAKTGLYAPPGGIIDS
jgi:hypothetical protein